MVEFWEWRGEEVGGEEKEEEKEEEKDGVDEMGVCY